MQLYLYTTGRCTANISNFIPTANLKQYTEHMQTPNHRISVSNDSMLTNSKWSYPPDIPTLLLLFICADLKLRYRTATRSSNNRPIVEQMLVKG